LSWWPSQNYLDILGWPRHVPPFGHGVRTPVSSSQSHLSNTLLLRLVSATHCPSDTPAAHPGVIVGSRYLTPFDHARSLHGVLMFVSMYSTTCSLGPLSFGFLLLAGDPHLEVGLIPQGGVLVMAWLGSCLWSNPILRRSSTMGAAHVCRCPGLGYISNALQQCLVSVLQVLRRRSPCQFVIPPVSPVITPICFEEHGMSGLFE
jgi:hypothetical protein